MRMRKSKKKGLTLIEIIISIALIGIIAVSFLSMFTMGFKYIANAGNKSKAIYTSQDEAENKLLDGASTASDSITIHFPASALHSAIDIQTYGEKVSKGSIRLFIPQ